MTNGNQPDSKQVSLEKSNFGAQIIGETTKNHKRTDKKQSNREEKNVWDY